VITGINGLGRRIKLFQREEAMTRGFELIEWTFDPLEIKNAYLNIEKLEPSSVGTNHQPVRHYDLSPAGRTTDRSADR